MRAQSGRSTVLTLFLVLVMLLSSFPLTTVFAPALPAAAAEAPAPPAAPAVCPAFSSAQSELVEYPSLALALDAAPFYAHPGDPVTATLVLGNDGYVPLEGVVVSVTVPAGLVEVRPSQGEYDAPSGRLRLALPRLDVGQALTVTVTARVTGPAVPEGHAILWAEASGGTLLFPVRDGALIVVGNPGQEARGRAEFQAASGGRLSSVDGRVAVDFPPGALQAPGLVRTGHVPWGLLKQERPAEQLPRPWAGYHRVLPPFELTAEDDMGGPLYAFSQPVTVTLSYDPEEVAALGMEEVDLAVFWWDADYVLTSTEGLTTTGLWIPIPSRVDTLNHVVTAAVGHFSNFALSDGSSPSDAFLPSVQAFQVSLLTGASSASYGINVPKGPGGLAPSLSLSYSSAASDGKGGLRDKQQAGWVGRGWSLGLDYIALVKNPSGDRNRNTYSVVLNGVSTDLVRHTYTETNLPNPHYHPADEQFWAVWQENVGPGTHYNNGVQQQDTVWYVLTKDGTRYQFGSTTPGDFGNRAWWGWDTTDDCSGGALYLETYKWYLTKVTDRHLNTVQYSYSASTSPNTPPYNYYYHSGCGMSVRGPLMADVWPTVIQWGDGTNLRLGVAFTSTVRTDDTQFDAAGLQLWQAPHETRRLDQVGVHSKQGTTWQLIRRYQLTYNYRLRPDNGHAYNKLTLLSAQMKGADGTTVFPATTFTYTLSGADYPYDTNGKYRLRTVDNGLGGTVTYTYTKIPTDSFVTQHRNRVTARAVRDGLGHTYTWTYDYTNPRENYQLNAASVWYALHVVGDTSYLVHTEFSEFRGHRKVVETDPNGNKVEHWYYQADGYDESNPACTIVTWNDACSQRQEGQEALLGKEWQTVWHSSDTNVTYRKVLSNFSVEPLDYDEATYKKYGLRRNFSYQSQSREYTYDTDATPRVKTTQYAYDPAYQGGTQWGNPTHTWEYGERTPGPGVDPLRTTVRQYVPNTATWVVGAPAQEGVFDGAESPNTWQSLAYTIYDNQDPFDPPTLGDVTRVMKARTLDVGTWWATTVDTAYGYDQYGNQTTVKVYNDDICGLTVYHGGSYDPCAADPRVTTTGYDTTYHVYPTSVTYPNGRSETAAYDYRMGLVTTYTDVNDDQTQYQYDTFGRFWKLWKPGDTEALPTVLNAYDFDTLNQLPVMWSVWRKGDPTAAPWTVGGTWERRFYDGMGRLVETQTPDYDWTGAANTHEIVAYTQYDGLGQKVAASVPYRRTAYQYAQCGGKVCTPYLAPDLGQARTLTAYDPVGRVLQVTNTDGTTVATAYKKWQTGVIDEKEHLVVQEADALGRMVSVREYTGPFGKPLNWNSIPTAYAQTVYGYDVRDQLTTVTDAAGNQTLLAYDKLGRKTDMTDPDMGHWSYAYDPLGNMTRQTDAKGQVINFSYDTMNRVTLKDLPTGDDVHYGYDASISTADANAMNSWGKLRQAWVGTSQTANAHRYRYDERGRTISETVWLDTGYTTRYTYDSADRGKMMTYPDGEVVTSSYLPNGQLNGVVGTSTYVGAIIYTPSGAVDVMNLGSSTTPTVTVDYEYFPWATANGRGRLKRVTAGPPATPTLLQDLRYYDSSSGAPGYDAVGNVTRIEDWKAGGPQTQTFTYDDLDRLLSGAASGGTYGNYGPENYLYGDAQGGKIGNLTSKAGVDYTYPASGPGSVQPHAVRRVNGSGGGAKTIDVYAWRTGTGNPTMQLYINGQYRYQWTVTATSNSKHTTTQTLTGNDVLEVVYTNDDGSRDLYVDRVVVDGTTIQAEGGAAVFDQGSGSAAFDGLSVVLGQEPLPGNGALRMVRGALASAEGYDANGNMTSRVRAGVGQLLTYDAENRLTKVEKSGSIMATFVYGPGGERVKGTVGTSPAVTTRYIGAHYEVQDGGPIRKYYYAGSTRVGVRESNNRVVLVLADHLGSTSIAANGKTGGWAGEVRYKAWGEDRPACVSPPCGGTPTTYRYTGQRQESYINMYYYGARWYDQALGRFISPDTTILQQDDPRHLDRFSYALNNPIRYTDPTGHYAFEENPDEPYRPQKPQEAVVPPLPGGMVTWPYGAETTSKKAGTWYHAGVDIAKRQGEPIYACNPGVVTQSEDVKDYGGTVVVETQGPGGRTYYETYTHMSARYVDEGDTVGRGMPVGAVGTCPLCTGPHLHYEVRLPAGVDSAGHMQSDNTLPRSQARLFEYYIPPVWVCSDLIRLANSGVGLTVISPERPHMGGAFP